MSQCDSRLLNNFEIQALSQYNILNYIFNTRYRFPGMKKLINALIFLFIFFIGYAQNEVIVKPNAYNGALRNPLKGFTTRGVNNHPWASTAHVYIRWNQIENHESDGIEKIISFCNREWEDLASKNTKVIPRVYLHWDGDDKYWPEDMQEDDYTSEQFKTRVVRLIERLGIVWDNDPCVAFVELGIFGKWGEQHSPFPTAAMEKLVGDAFAKAFKNKKVSVRRNWERFTHQPFGEYWDSWAHYDQMWGHGNSIKLLNDQGRYKETYIGGEVAYNWGNSDIQPGPSPTQSVAIKKHRDFVINSIRWLHCTQLRWIDDYDRNNPDAAAGAEEIQKVFGYRFLLDEVRFSLNDSLRVSFDVTNTGSAPFYYAWPVEVALLDSVTHKPVWKAKMDNVDIRDWMPGDGWTDPEWKYVGSWQEYHPNVNWNSSVTPGWTTPPALNRVEENFKVDLPDGTYILSLSILDPAGDLPSVKFATTNYLNGGRHPVGLVHVGEHRCDTLPDDFQFDDPKNDNSLYYDDDFEIVYERDPEQTPFTGNAWRFPSDTVSAWQYDFMDNFQGEKYFSVDSDNSIGIYGCNDTSGINIRNYKDSLLHSDAAQFYWNQTSGTFQKNGQWLEYTSNLLLDLPYQLLLRARNNADAKFRLTVLTTRGDTVFHEIFSLENDFKNLGDGNEQTDWFLSKIPLTGLQGTYIIRFDWYDNVGEPGIFGGFTFVKSNLDVTPPEWYYVDIGTFRPGTELTVMTTEEATVYLVPEGTPSDTNSIKQAAVSVTETKAYIQAKLATADVETGLYIIYALDSSNNISEASRTIQLQYPVTANEIASNSSIEISYHQRHNWIQVNSVNEINNIELYDILGKKVGSKKCRGKSFGYPMNDLMPGIYFVRIVAENEIISVNKIYKN